VSVCANACTDDTGLCVGTALCALYASTLLLLLLAVAVFSYCYSIACPTRTNDSAGMPCVSLVLLPPLLSLAMSSKNDALPAVVCDSIIDRANISCTM
jgi:hypothetical protein